MKRKTDFSKRIRINLTVTQNKKLTPLHLEALRAFEEGKPGVIFAQVRSDGSLDACFIEQPEALAMIKITGASPDERA